MKYLPNGYLSNNNPLYNPKSKQPDLDNGSVVC